MLKRILKNLYVNWTHLAQNRFQWRGLVNKVMDLVLTLKARSFSIPQPTLSPPFEGLVSMELFIWLLRDSLKIFESNIQHTSKLYDFVGPVDIEVWGGVNFVAFRASRPHFQTDCTSCEVQCSMSGYRGMTTKSVAWPLQGLPLQQNSALAMVPYYNFVNKLY